MLRSRNIIIMAILILILPVLNAVQEKIEMSAQEITLEFDNIRIKDIDFYKGDEVIVKYSSRDDLNIETVDNILAFSSKYETRITLKLPVTKSYNFNKDDAFCFFNSQMMEIRTDDEIIRFSEEKLEVIENDHTKVEIGKQGIIVDDDDEHVVIDKEGILVEGDDNTELTGFWGKMLGSVIQSIARTAINFAGKRPEKIAKYIINDDDDNNYNYNLGIDLDCNNDQIEKIIEEDYYPPASSVLTLHNMNGSVSIRSWDNDYLHLKRTKKTGIDEDEFEKVKVTVKEGADFSVITEHLEKNPKVSVSFEISIPKSMKLSEIVTSNGTIKLENTIGEADLISSNGSVNIEDHQGDLIIRTSNGAIDINNVTGKVSGYTSNGSIDLENISGEVIANTDNGSVEIKGCPLLSKVYTSNARIELEILQLDSDLDVITSNGSINLYISESVNAEVKASTSNGGISSNHPGLNTENVSRNHLYGKLGSGGRKLFVQTSNSSIRLETLEEIF